MVIELSELEGIIRLSYYFFGYIRKESTYSSLKGCRGISVLRGGGQKWKISSKFRNNCITTRNFRGIWWFHFSWVVVVLCVPNHCTPVELIWHEWNWQKPLTLMGSARLTFVEPMSRLRNRHSYWSPGSTHHPSNLKENSCSSFAITCGSGKGEDLPNIVLTHHQHEELSRLKHQDLWWPSHHMFYFKEQ